MSCKQISLFYWATSRLFYNNPISSLLFLPTQFNEDNFKDEEPVSSPTTGSPGVSESEIGNLLSKNQLAEALIACLNNFGTTGVKNQAEKVGLPDHESRVS